MFIKFLTLNKKKNKIYNDTVQKSKNTFQYQILTKKQQKYIDQQKINLKYLQQNKNIKHIFPPMLKYYATQLNKRLYINKYNLLKKKKKSYKKINKLPFKNKKVNPFLSLKLSSKNLRNHKKKLNLYLKKNKKLKKFKNTDFKQDFKQHFISNLVFPKIKKSWFFKLLKKLNLRTLSRKKKQNINNKLYIYSNFKPLNFNISQQWNFKKQLLFKKQPLLSLVKKQIYPSFLFWNNVQLKKNTHKNIFKLPIIHLFPIKKISSVSIITPFLIKNYYLKNKHQNFKIINLYNKRKNFIFLYRKKYLDKFPKIYKTPTYTQYRTSFNLPKNLKTLKEFLQFRDQYWETVKKSLKQFEQRKKYNFLKRIKQKKIKQKAKILKNKIKKIKLKKLREHPLFLKRIDWNFINKKYQNKKLKQNKNKKKFLQNIKKISLKSKLNKTLTKKVNKKNLQKYQKTYQIIRVFAGRNNTILTLSNRWGQKNITFSIREMGFTGGQNRIPLTSQELGYQFALLLTKILKISNIYLIFQGPGKKRKQLIRGLTRTKRIRIQKIFIKIKIQHNGCRKPKKKRK